MSNKSVESACESFFARLDHTNVAAETVLNRDNDKDWLETFVLRALDRIGAAEYHRERIRELTGDIDVMRHALNKPSPDAAPIGSGASRRTEVSWSPREVAYEMDAFLSAVRSATDFSASLLARYIRGVGSVRSITKLLKHAENIPAPLGPLLLKWKNWVEFIKEYRDQYVHYQTLRGTVSVRVETKEGAKASAVRPFVVAETVGSGKPDTRATREYEHVCPEGIIEVSTTMHARDVDSRQEPTSHEIRFAPAPGYVTLDEFATKHLGELQQFFIAVLEAAGGLEFRLVKMRNK